MIMTRNNGRFLKAVLTATALFVCWAMSGCGENGGILLGFGGNGNTGGNSSGGSGSDRPGPGVESSLVGDWKMYSISTNGETRDTGYYPYERTLVSFKSSGEFAVTEFYKVGNVWVEYPAVERGTWRVRNDTLYYSDPNGEGERNERYTVTGNRLVMKQHQIREICEDIDDIYSIVQRQCSQHDYYYEYTFIMVVNTADFKSGLGGTIYPYNPVLRGEWILQNGNSECDDPWCYERIYFGSTSFSETGAYRYITNDNNGDGRYYTNGGSLYLVIENCYWDDQYIKHCTTKRPVVLPYSVSGSGNNRTLTINGDIWRVWQSQGKARDKDSFFPFAALPALKDRR
ncbi:MAG: lipocalin family protein [Chitinispirillales bacterium]|jgi:hypothetical protein|nr:lipocalin family protein [Chitinispirillales bacterium]